jgi:hypothetical protein
MFAPIEDKRGARPAFYENMTKVSPGDVALHYVEGSIYWISIVQKSAIETDRPRLPDETRAEKSVAGLEKPGRLIETDYRELSPPIEKSEIPEKWCVPELGPFYTGAWAGRPKMGYLWAVTEEFVWRLREKFPDRWPSLAVWADD